MLENDISHITFHSPYSSKASFMDLDDAETRDVRSLEIRTIGEDVSPTSIQFACIKRQLSTRDFHH